MDLVSIGEATDACQRNMMNVVPNNKVQNPYHRASTTKRIHRQKETTKTTMLNTCGQDLYFRMKHRPTNNMMKHNDTRFNEGLC